MENEKVVVDETTETVVEQNARAYTKTKWTESTPITVDKLNKMETGIANALDTTTGGTINGKITVKGDIQSNGGNFYSNKNGVNKPVIEVFDGNEKGNAVAYSAGGLTILAGGEASSVVAQNIPNTDEHAVVAADNGVKLYANLQNGWESKKTVELSSNGRFKLNNNSLEFSPDNSGYARMGIDGNTQDIFISNINNNWFRLKSDKTITYAGNKVYTSFDKPKAAEIGALPLKGGTMTGSIVLPNSVAGQIQQTLSDGTITSTLYITAGNILKIGSADVPNVCIHSKNNPQVSVNGTTYTLYHTGKKPTAADVGALALTGGTLTGALTVSGNSKNVVIGTGGSDVYVHNSASGKYLQLKDDGILMYSDSKIYHEGNKPTAWDIGAMSSNAPSFQGNMIQAGPGGRDWIYHINADMGSLHIAPHSNGNNDWDNQIQFDRNGVIYCNGRKKVPTMADQHAAHYMFRYGSGLGGANGYITFSY